MKRTSSKANQKDDNGEGNDNSQDLPTQVPVVPVNVMELYTAPTFLPAVLTFSLEDAKKHLIEADPRFEDVFDRLKCRPFEQLERVDPFR